MYRNYDFVDDPINELVEADRRIGELEDELGDLRERLADYEEQLPRWIPVEERLPEERVEALLHYDDGSMEVGKYLGLGCVTHWMPLPDPPEAM